MKKIVIFLIGLFSFFLACSSVKATTLQDLYDDLSALEKSYSAAKDKANMTQKELNNLKVSISSTEAEINRAQSEITQAEKDIVSSEAEIDKKKEETNQLLLYLQLTSSKGNSMLEYIFEADDYTDFIYRYSVVTQMSDYNQGLVDELNALITQLNNKKVELSKKQEELAVKKSELQSKYAIMQVQYKEENDAGLDIADQISEKKKIIKHYESLGCKRTSDINSCNGMAAVDGWAYPLNSFTQSSNYGWDENRYHYAVDLGTPEGREVKAVGNGEVLSATLTSTVSSCYSSLTKKSYTNCHCGGYVVQILHNYNGSNYVSLYMHLLSSNVKRGDKVYGGQVIGTSGGGVKEVEKWHDYCTGGAHLHFTMSYGASLIGYSSQKGSTFDPVKFFPAMKGIGSRFG